MRVYFVSDTVRHAYRGTLAEAHALAKSGEVGGVGFVRDWVRVEEVEVATDKAAILRLLNGEGGAETTLRAWELTPRGGLRPADTPK